MRKNQAALATLILCFGILSGITIMIHHAPETTRTSRLAIVCSTTILADALQTLVDDSVVVSSLMGPLIDPHTYRARESDLKQIINADLIVYHGLHLEGKMADMLSALTHAPSTSCAAALETSDLIVCDDFPGVYDPHVWMDITLWVKVIDHLATFLAHHDPDYRELYHRRCAAYTAELRALDDWVVEKISSIPHTKKILITAHDAFAYFGRRYGIRVVGLQGISTDSEPSILDIQLLTTLIVEHALPTMFVESSVPIRPLQAVQRSVAAHGHCVSFGEKLYTDALGTHASGVDTYCRMIRHNVQALVNGLH